MIRRTFEIHDSQEMRITEMAERLNLDKSEIVQLALLSGLDTVNEHFPTREAYDNAMKRILVKSDALKEKAKSKKR
jgi:hypothetical protein